MFCSFIYPLECVVGRGYEKHVPWHIESFVCLCVCVCVRAVLCPLSRTEWLAPVEPCAHVVSCPLTRGVSEAGRSVRTCVRFCGPVPSRLRAEWLEPSERCRFSAQTTRRPAPPQPGPTLPQLRPLLLVNNQYPSTRRDLPSPSQRVAPSSSCQLF